MKHIQHAVRAALLSALLALMAGCQSVQTTQPGTVGVTRSQQMSVSREAVDAQSAQAYAKMMGEANAKGELNRDQAMLARVRAIANRLIPQAAVFRPDATGWKWETNLLQSDQVNAFCMAGGKIAVYSALITKLQLTDDELAAVMGHEMAHALREHVREQISEQQGLGALAMIAGIASGSQGVQTVTGQALQVGVGLKHSRRAEREADDMGLELAARAGYDPRAAVSLWTKMNKLGGGRPPEFLSTHPSPETRQQDLAQVANVVMPLYQKAPKN